MIISLNFLSEYRVPNRKPAGDCPISEADGSRRAEWTMFGLPAEAFVYIKFHFRVYQNANDAAHIVTPSIDISYYFDFPEDSRNLGG